MQSPLTPCTGCAWLLGESKPLVRISPPSTVQANSPWEEVSMEGQGLNHPTERGYVPLLAEWGLRVLVAAGRGCAAWQMVERSHRRRWEHSGQDGI